jgi:predicted nucleic acid-binding protein
MLDLRVDLYPFAPLAVRIWEMRDDVRCYDAWYVALAELLDAPVVTLDRRLARSAGPRCEFRTPPVQAS